MSEPLAWWLILEGMGAIAFPITFVLFSALLRAYMHDINYGEKPQNLAFLNAVLRSDSLPAYDPWYSGHDLSYYYLGHLMVAILARLAHTPASVAFNLGSATIGAPAASPRVGLRLH